MGLVTTLSINDIQYNSFTSPFPGSTVVEYSTHYSKIEGSNPNTGTWTQCYKTFLSVIDGFFNEARLFVLASIYRLVSCFRVRPEPTHKHQTRLEKLARDKHSSLIKKSANYGQKSFITLGPGASVGIRTLDLRIMSRVFDPCASWTGQ